VHKQGGKARIGGGGVGDGKRWWEDASKESLGTAGKGCLSGKEKGGGMQERGGNVQGKERMVAVADVGGGFRGSGLL